MEATRLRMLAGGRRHEPCHRVRDRGMYGAGSAPPLVARGRAVGGGAGVGAVLLASCVPSDVPAGAHGHVRHHPPLPRGGWHEGGGRPLAGALHRRPCCRVGVLPPARFGATFVNTADGDDVPTGWWKRLLSALDAKYEWRDSEASAGYCRRNRLLFSDYTQRFHRFIVVEMGMCIVTGALEGMQGRSGQCIGVMVALVVVLVSFCTVQVVLRPYNESAVSVFSVATSFFQSVAASAMLLHIAFHTENALDVVEVATMCLSYLMLLNLVFALYPRLHAALILAWDQLTSMSERGVQGTQQRRGDTIAEEPSEALLSANTVQGLLTVAELQQPMVSSEAASECSHSTPPPPLADDIGDPISELLNEPDLGGSAHVDRHEWPLLSDDQEAPKGAPLLFFESDERGRDNAGNRWEPLLREEAFSLKPPRRVQLFYTQSPLPFFSSLSSK